MIIVIDDVISLFLQGNGTNVVRIIPYTSVQFASYEEYKKVGCVLCVCVHIPSV